MRRAPRTRGRRSKARPLLTPLAVASTLLLGEAHAQGVKIVGIGAATCQDFLRESAGRPDVEKNYFAWAQGYMSGLLIRAPAGMDEDLDLSPPSFSLLKQAAFLRANRLRDEFG